MIIQEIGIESSLLKQIQEGKKKVEVRLYKGKFLSFRPGHRIKLRKDTYNNGRYYSSSLTDTMIEITNIEQYKSLKELLQEVNYSVIFPEASNEDEYIKHISLIYSAADQKKLGFLAIHFKLI